MGYGAGWLNSRAANLPNQNTQVGREAEEKKRPRILYILTHLFKWVRYLFIYFFFNHFSLPTKTRNLTLIALICIYLIIMSALCSSQAFLFTLPSDSYWTHSADTLSTACLYSFTPESKETHATHVNWFGLLFLLLAYSWAAGRKSGVLCRAAYGAPEPEA